MMKTLPRLLAALSFPVLAAILALAAPASHAMGGMQMHDGPPPWSFIRYNSPGDDYRYQFKAASQQATMKYRDIRNAYRDGYVPFAVGVGGHPTLHLINYGYLLDLRTFDVNKPEVLVYYQKNSSSQVEGLVGSMFFGLGAPVARFPGSTDGSNTMVYFHVYYMCDLRQAYMLHPQYDIHYPQDTCVPSTPKPRPIPKPTPKPQPTPVQKPTQVPTQSPTQSNPVQQMPTQSQPVQQAPVQQVTQSWYYK